MNTSNFQDKEKVKEAILDYRKTLNNEDKGGFGNSKEASDLIVNNFFAFLLGVIFDQSVRASKAWSAPYKLKQRLGHLDPEKIAQMSDEEIIDIFDKKPKLHRFPEKMALWIRDASKKVVNDYEGDGENITKNYSTAEEITKKFREFKGIGQKKASMATNILVRKMGLDVEDKEKIDVSYDIHVRRVFLRSGLVERDTKELIVNTARELNPQYPGALDFPAWSIGNNFCHPTDPNCKGCPLENVCAKKTELRVETV